MKKIANPISIVIALITCHLLLVTNVNAQSALGLSAIPPRVQITAAPGEVQTAILKVRNQSDVTKFVTTDIKDFIVTDDLGTPIQLDEIVTEEENRWAASTWLHISPTSLQLKPGETKSLTLTVIVPDDALPGGHYAMVLHTPDNTTMIDSTGSTIKTNIGSLVYITVPGDIKQNAVIKKFFAPKFQEFGPVNFETLITNLSDIHITPVGSIKIHDLLGRQIANLPLNEINIFPYTSRDFQNTLDKKWLFGRFKASLSAGYGLSGQALAATLYFWVIPWRLIVLALAAIAIVATLVYLLKNQKKSKP